MAERQRYKPHHYPAADIGISLARGIDGKKGREGELARELLSRATKNNLIFRGVRNFDTGRS